MDRGAEGDGPLLIQHQWPKNLGANARDEPPTPWGEVGTPAYIREHVEYIRTTPFDGTTINTPSGWDVMTGVPRSYDEIAADFAPLRGLELGGLRHNFAGIWTNRPADFFDDWSPTVASFGAFARVLRELGIAGVLLDNEEYGDGLYQYPHNCAYPDRSLEEYQAQARLRGREVMVAMVAEFPAISVIVLHGPYTSCPATPAHVRGRQTEWRLEQLRGPFTVGLMQGMGERSTLFDGGEVYAYRTEAAFERSYRFRKYGIAEPGVCPFIPEELRPVWADRLGIGFGVYNKEWPKGCAMTPQIMRTTLERALRRCDRYAWQYTEEANWFAPGGIGQDWIDAVEGARAAVGRRGS